MPRDTGFPRADAENDFLRARRRQVLARLAAWMRREPDDVSLILPFDEVVGALGKTGERYLGLRVIGLDTIVGSVDRTRDFDRLFRPTTGRVRQRWEGIALAQRQGVAVPPIDVYRVGEMHFVRDGHHRVSVAHTQGAETIEAAVTEVRTTLSPTGVSHVGDLAVKDYWRVFLERVPLPPAAQTRIRVSDPWNLTELGETVEAWGFRTMQEGRQFLDRGEIARRWYDEEYVPVVRLLGEADLIGDRTETDAYLVVSGQRYRLIRQHRWDDDVVERLRELNE